MTLIQQILWGSLYLGICLIAEIVILAVTAQFLRKLDDRLGTAHRALHSGTILSTALIFIILAHTIQVWLWASVFVLNQVLPDWNAAVYFSLVTYTSLGYGDIVLGPGLRIFAAFASVTGLLGFGMSTAFLVALMTRLFFRPAH